ncbi:universal stress protein, partial [Hymenobacter agri]
MRVRGYGDRSFFFDSKAHQPPPPPPTPTPSYPKKMTILCPLDFSAASASLVAYAAALAVAYGAELRLLHVCEPQEDPAGQRPD